jgi:hypothetical protein
VRGAASWPAGHSAIRHGVSVIVPTTWVRYRKARALTRSTAEKSGRSCANTIPTAKSIRRYRSPASDAARISASCWTAVWLRYSIEWLPRLVPYVGTASAVDGTAASAAAHATAQSDLALTADSLFDRGALEDGRRPTLYPARYASPPGPKGMKRAPPDVYGEERLAS